VQCSLLESVVLDLQNIARISALASRDQCSASTVGNAHDTLPSARLSADVKKTRDIQYITMIYEIQRKIGENPVKRLSQL
jgi:hypothetical protein